MGSLATAKCECGFTKRFLLGGGMSNHLTYCGFPCYCQDCKFIFEANLYSSFDSKMKNKRINCSYCFSNNTVVYDDESLRKSSRKIIESQTYYTPQNRLSKLLRLPKKKFTTHVFSDQEIFSWNTVHRLGRDIYLTKENYFCPECECFRMIFFIDGFFD